MQYLSMILVAIVAIEHIYILVLEMFLWTKISFSAVHLWPLKLSAPATHSFMVLFRFASSKTMAGFFASNPKTCLSRFGFGCCEASAFELFELPIKAKTSTSPVFIMGPARVLPLPKTTLSTPGGKAS